jgi:hypothetical protein
MKTATIYAVRTDTGPGYAWLWRCTTDGTRSAAAFEFYYDCVTDARKHGCAFEPTPAHGVMAPGGGCYALDTPR